MREWEMSEYARSMSRRKRQNYIPVVVVIPYMHVMRGLRAVPSHSPFPNNPVELRVTAMISCIMFIPGEPHWERSIEDMR